MLEKEVVDAKEIDEILGLAPAKTEEKAAENAKTPAETKPEMPKLEEQKEVKEKKPKTSKTKKEDKPKQTDLFGGQDA